jgi:hypothetical protein
MRSGLVRCTETGVTGDTPRYIDFSLHYHLAFLVLPAAFLAPSVSPQSTRPTGGSNGN